MSETQNAELLREITIYNTIGNNRTTLNTSAQFRSDIINELAGLGVHIGDMSLIMENEVELTTDDTRLMQGPHAIFLMPSMVKSGSC